MDLELVVTERLRLERWAERHTEALVAMNRDPEVMRFIGDGAVLEREGSEALSRRLGEHWEQFGFGLWAVVARHDGRTYGFAGLSHPRWFPEYAHEVEVGWRLRRDAWGRGYATEAGRAALGAAFDSLNLKRVVSLIHPDNERSIAVARRLGLELERTVPHPLAAARVAVYATLAPQALHES